MDLIVRNARPSDRTDGELFDIGIDKGRIVAIEKNLAADGKVYDAKGNLACPGLIETHIHLDKSRIIDRCAPQERSKLSPVFGVTPIKPAMTIEDVYERAKKHLRSALSTAPPGCARSSRSIPASGCAASKVCRR